MATEDKTLQEIREIMKNLAISQAKGEQEAQERKKEEDARKKEADERQAKLDKQIEKTSRGIEALRKQLGSITSNQADMTEEFIHNTIDYHGKKIVGDTV